MKCLNIKVSVTGIILSLLLVIVLSSFSGLSSVMLIAAGSTPIDDNITPSSGNSLTSTITSSPASENISSSADTTTTNTTAPRVELEDEPFAIGHYIIVSQNRTSEGRVDFTFEGNTTITPPNSTETIMTRDTGQGNITHLLGGGGNIVRMQIHMTTEDESESVIAHANEIFETEPSTAIGVAHFGTNSSELLATLNNMIAVLLDEVVVPEGIPPGEFPGEDFIVYFFEWKGGSIEEE
jgi:hypothetical protein